MARQRVQHLGEELRDAGLLPPEDDDTAPPVLVRAPGRHARAGSRSPALARVGAQVAERVPFTPAHLVVLVGVAAVVLVGVAWVRISASSEAVPAPRPQTSASSSESTGQPSAAAPGSPGSSSPGTVVVDVAGKVRHPGVLTLPAGSRVLDAVRRAGGARGGADLTGLNLARVLVDGEQILVGVGPPAAASSGPPGGPAADPAGGGQVSLNRATLEELETLPGVGPVTAQKILDYRTAHGAFGSVEELLDVDGIGEKTLARLAPHLTL